MIHELEPMDAQASRIAGPAPQRALEFKTFGFPLAAAASADLPASPGEVRRDGGGRPVVLHFAPGRYLVPAPTPEISRRLGALQDAGIGAVFDVDGKWQALTLEGPGARRLLAATFDPARVLTDRDCAALQLFDCPAVLACRAQAFDIWVEASYAQALLDRLQRQLRKRPGA
jgi:heterotetrameric sarcosine oxidase gamma subunit